MFITNQQLLLKKNNTFQPVTWFLMGGLRHSPEDSDNAEDRNTLHPTAEFLVSAAD